MKIQLTNPQCFNSYGIGLKPPFAVFKTLFHQLLQSRGRAERRTLQIPQELLLIDSTTVTVGKTRLPWAPYHGERAGEKLHVAWDATSGQPRRVEETTAVCHAGPLGEVLTDPSYTLVQDRAYGKIGRYEQWNSENAPVKRDITCQLGTPGNRSQKRHRVMVFEEVHGHDIRVVTNLMHITAEEIALMYRARWQIELFFRWIKQHLNIPTLFGTTEKCGVWTVVLSAYRIRTVKNDVGSRRPSCSQA
ncbi:IS4/IS5 family transposase [Paenibacillus sp. 28ISP30-2]|nr:IS4/IS5 family transposase [Paenibacillus sp. 28ISP30-2]